MKLINKKNSVYLFLGVGLVVLLYCFRNNREGLDADNVKINKKSLDALKQAKKINHKNILNKINAINSVSEVSSNIADLTKTMQEQDSINKAIQIGLETAKHAKDD
jgi:hypothetical protein